MDSDRFFVKSLTLENFRCFEKVALGPFDPHFNLLIGENGAGKSSVLVALASLFLTIGDPFPRRGGMRLVHLADVRLEHLVSPEGVTTLKLHSPAVLGAQAGFNNKDLLARDELDVSPSGAGLVPLLTATDGHGFVPAQDFREVPAPIIVFYRTGRLFARDSSPTAPSNFKQGAREQAFEFWWDAGVRSEYLREWFKTQTLVDLQHLLRSRANGFSNETQQQVRLLPVVSRAIATAVPRTRTINFDADRDDIVVEFDDGIRVDFSTMSDGQRAFIGLIADLARRVCILNAYYLGNKTLEETTGLVLIDELDAHLHPKWQRQVVGALKQIFPRIQFFATTHSPQVIGEARPEEIVLLTPQGQKRAVGSYGMDSNWVLERVMEAEGRDPVIAKRIKDLFDAIDDDRIEEAKAMITALRADIGEAPDIVGAESYIWRIEHQGDEAAE